MRNMTSRPAQKERTKVVTTQMMAAKRRNLIMIFQTVRLLIRLRMLQKKHKTPLKTCQSKVRTA
jgi:hypothetical protein